MFEQYLTRKNLKRILIIGSLVFLLMNIIAFIHAYKFTHFSTSTEIKTQSPEKLSFGEKLSTLLFGVSNPRPYNSELPQRSYEEVYLKSSKAISCWSIQVEKSKGTVIMFHGYSSNKSALLEKSKKFNSIGYSTFLVDFMGSGASEGKQTSMGYHEAEQVKLSFDYLQSKGEENIFLFGSSMGAVAIMKAVSEEQLETQGIIIECPFGSLYQTVKNRFEEMGAPKFPMAALLVFWGGVQNDFWGFGLKPSEYATKINCPTLLMYGIQDTKVKKEEIEEIFANLEGEKDLRMYVNAGHNNYLENYDKEWSKDVKQFLQNYRN